METECSWLPAATVSSPSSRSCDAARHRASVCTPGSHKRNNSDIHSHSDSNKSSTHLRSKSRCLMSSPCSSSSSSSSSSASVLSRASQPTTASSSGGYSNSNSNKRHQSRVMSTYSSTCSPAYCLSSCINMLWWQCLLLFTCLLLTSSTVNAQYKPQWPDPMLAREIFVLNLEDGYFGCQVNESVDFLQLFELSKLCDGAPQCFRGSDELSVQLKCTDRSKYLIFLSKHLCECFFSSASPSPLLHHLTRPKDVYTHRSLHALFWRQVY